LDYRCPPRHRSSCRVAAQRRRPAIMLRTLAVRKDKKAPASFRGALPWVSGVFPLARARSCGSFASTGSVCEGRSISIGSERDRYARVRITRSTRTPTSPNGDGTHRDTFGFGCGPDRGQPGLAVGEPSLVNPLSVVPRVVAGEPVLSTV